MPVTFVGETLANAQEINLSSQPLPLNNTPPFGQTFFYRFSLTSRSSLLLDSESIGFIGSQAADIALLDTTGAVINVNGKAQISTNQGSLPNLINTVLNPGTYYIRVFASNTPSTSFFNPFNINLTAQINPGSAAVEPIPYDMAGNTSIMARNLGTLNELAILNEPPALSRGSYTNQLTISNPEDYYRFQVTNLPVNFNFSFTGLQNSVGIQLIRDLDNNGLLDPTELPNAIAANQSSALDKTVNRILDPGTYFIHVNRVDGDTSYTLNLSTAEVNDLLSGEIEVGNLGITPRSYSTTLNSNNTADVYRFTLFDNSNISLQLSGLAGTELLETVNAKLYSQDGHLLQRSTANSINPGQIARTLERGTYYVLVYGSNSSSITSLIDYNLNLSANVLLPTNRVSTASDGSQGLGQSGGTDLFGSFFPAISANGRYVAFTSFSSNLVARDTNGSSDVFVRDRLTGETSLISVASDGTQANFGAGAQSSISADGRYVTFISSSSNLVSGDTNGNTPDVTNNKTGIDVFVHDRLTQQTRRVSVASDGTEANANSESATISADGRYVTFTSYASNLVSGDTNGSSEPFSIVGLDVFVHDLVTGQTTRVSVASDGTQSNGGSLFPVISADGRYVSFTSSASNLVSGDTNNLIDVFVHDRTTGQTSLASVATDNTPAGGYHSSISADGRYLSFTSSAANLVAGDTNNTPDIFVRDLVTRQITRVSVASDGTQANTPISAAFFNPFSSISADGQYVIFSSASSNLVAGDSNNAIDIFVHDRTTGKTRRVSLADNNAQGNGDSIGKLNPSGYYDSPVISADGRYVAFTSAASNLVDGDTNYANDIFVRDLAG